MFEVRKPVEWRKEGIIAPERNLVILNQAASYLTVGFANAFNRELDSVTLVTGSVHVQGGELDDEIRVHTINRWHERPPRKKALSYALALVRMWWLLMTRYRRHEVLFISVPPMGYLLNLFLPHRFTMVIWDVYPDIVKIGGMSERHPVYRIWAALNRRSFNKAYRLFTISEPMAEAVAAYVGRSKVTVHLIWAIGEDFERVPESRNLFLQGHDLHGKFIVQYSGNIGLTHNVEVLIEIADRLQHGDDILFQIIHLGPRRACIEHIDHERGLEKLQFLPLQSDEITPHLLPWSDLGMLELRERDGQSSVSSTASNLMSFGIPL